jgi:hypothetical protein
MRGLLYPQSYGRSRRQRDEEVYMNTQGRERKKL